MTLHIKDGATWREPTEVHIKDGATWRSATEVHVNDGGTWRMVFNAVTAANVVLPNAFAMGSDAAPVSASACRADVWVELDGDTSRASNEFGTSQGTKFDSGDWVDDKTGIDSTLYEYNVTRTLGFNTPLGTSLHGNTTTWTTLSSELHWYFSSSSGQDQSCTLRLQIREIANTSNIDEVSFPLSANGDGF